MLTRLTPYALLSPAFLVLAISGLIPAGYVIFYSLHDTFAGNSFVWVGTAWYQSVLSSREFWWAFARSIGFSALVLAVEVPLGIYIALRLPPKGWLASLYIVLLAIPCSRRRSWSAICGRCFRRRGSASCRRSPASSDSPTT